MPTKEQKVKVKQAIARGRALPSNIEAEQNLLGCMLADSDIALDIVSMLEKDDFYLESHKIIVDAMKSLSRSGSPIELVTVKDQLDRSFDLEKVGGLNYLIQLNESTPSSVNYKVYLRIVKRCSSLRQLIHSCSETIEEAYVAEDDKVALATAEKRIFDISQGKNGSEITNLADSAYAVLQRFDDAHRRRGAMTGITTGIKRLDILTRGFQKGTLLILAATTGIGKSSLALNMAEHASRHGKKVAIFSLEMPKEEIAQRFVCSMSGISMTDALAGKLNDSDWERIDVAVSALSKLDIYVDDSSMTTPDQLLSKCRRIKSRHGLDFVIVDYLQLMSMSNTVSAESRQREISEITRNLKIISKELNVPILALSQLSREAAKRNYSDKKEPVLSDLRESGAIEQDADMVMFIHKPYETADARPPVEEVSLIVAKHRNGALDKIPLRWIGSIVKFCNSDEEAAMARNVGAVIKSATENAPMPDEDAPMPDDDVAVIESEEGAEQSVEIIQEKVKPSRQRNKKSDESIEETVADATSDQNQLDF